MRLAGIGLAAALLVSQGCVESHVPPPETPPPSLLAPSDAVPGDLDVVVRIDWSAIRSALPESTRELGLAMLGQGHSEELAPLYSKADAVWVAFRPGPGLQPLDTVMVFQGRLGVFDPASRLASDDWLPARDLGGGWRRWERARAVTRGEWARLYQRHDELVVALTVAEVDSVERVIEHRASDPRVRAPERGIVSLGVRLGPWVETQGGPGLAWLGRASTLEAYLELGGGEALAEADIGFDHEDQAARGAEAVSLLKQALTGELGRFEPALAATTVASVGRHLILRYQGPLQFEEDRSRGAASRQRQGVSGSDGSTSGVAGDSP